MAPAAIAFLAAVAAYAGPDGYLVPPGAPLPAEAASEAMLCLSGAGQRRLVAAEAALEAARLENEALRRLATELQNSLTLAESRAEEALSELRFTESRLARAEAQLPSGSAFTRWLKRRVNCTVGPTVSNAGISATPAFACGINILPTD